MKDYLMEKMCVAGATMDYIGEALCCIVEVFIVALVAIYTPIWFPFWFIFLRHK